MKCQFLPGAIHLVLPACTLILCGTVWSLGTLYAQSPFDVGGAAAADDTETDADDAEKTDSPLDKLIAAEQDPLVLAIVQSRPTTPAQWIYDVRSLVNLRRYEISREYLKEFLAALPDASTLADIQAQFGSALFLRITRLAELQPEGKQVADAVMQAAADRLQDATRLSALVDQYLAAAAPERRKVLAELIKSGAAAAAPLIQVLADDSRAADHGAVRSALVALGDEAARPVMTSLASDNAALRLRAMQILTDLKSLDAVPFVLPFALAEPPDPAADNAQALLRAALGQVPSRAEASRYLAQRIDNYLAGAAPGPVDQNDDVTLWIWDVAQQAPRQQTMPSADASFLSAALLANARHRLDPSDPEGRLLQLATGMELAKRLNGYGRPLTEELGTIFQDATAADTQTLEAVLTLAQKQQMEGAAVAAIELLARTKDAQLLGTDDGKPSLLAQALLSPHARVKAAAAHAIMDLDPASAYPGSSYLPEVLGYLSASGGHRRVLVGHPRREQSLQLAGYFRVLGFEVDSCQRGRDVMLQAVSNPDYSFILLHDAIDRPGYRELIQMLRHDQRTGQLPVGLIVREENAESAEWFARTDALTLDLAPPQTQADVALDTRRLLSLSGRSVMTEDEKLAHARFALSALSQLRARPREVLVLQSDGLGRTAGAGAGGPAVDCPSGPTAGSAGHASRSARC